MKSFLLKVFSFIIIILFLVIGGQYALYKTIDTGNYYKLNKKNENLILGHSHTECAYNDTILKNTINLSNGGEGVFYTYFKLKKIVENNKIKNAFISFTNNNIGIGTDYPIWNEKYINKWYSKYGAYMGLNDISLLFKNNPKAFISVQSITSKKYLSFLLKRKKSIIEDQNWGHFYYLKRDKIDSLIKETTYKKVKLTKYKYAYYSLNYFDSIVRTCKEKKINLYFIRSPLHKLCNDDENEYFFNRLLQTRYKEVTFLDFKNFPAPNNCYGDLEHLNYRGSNKFSTFFNNLLKKGLLKMNNKQEYINQEMKKL